MTNTTATVETLTAEVHVLQVGNRQITLCVVKQLDRVRYVELEPMGRVRSGRKEEPGAGECHLEVVGRSYTDGALVFAFAPTAHIQAPPEWLHWMQHADPGGGERQMITVERDGYPSSQWVDLHRLWPMFMGDDVGIDRHQFTWAYPSYDSGRVRYCDRRADCDLPALCEAWQGEAECQYSDAVDAVQMCAEAVELPLIVLAGLK
jgi:hypothetical protein